MHGSSLGACALALVLLAAATACASDAGAGLVPTHYDLSLEPDYESATLSGTAAITLSNHSDAPLSEVAFLLYRTMPVAAALDGAGRVLDVEQAVVSFEDFPPLQVNRVLVRLVEPVAPGESTTLSVEYGGHLLGYTETGMLYVKDGIERGFTILRNDAFAFPIVCGASIGEMRASVENTFTYEARVTVPADLVVVNGGRLTGVEPARDGATAYTYVSIAPSWRMDFAIGPYETLERGPVRVSFLPGDEEGALRVADAAAAALGHYEGWFGPLERESGLTFIEIPDGWGSQADVTAVIQTSVAFSDPERIHEVYHEVSHLWNAPAVDHPSPRWEEGLAMFLEYLVLEVESGEPAVDARANELMERLSTRLANGPGWADVAFIDYGRTGLTDLSYTVGGLFFDLTYRVAGRDAFNSTIGDYLAEYGEAGGTTDDFARVARERCPEGVDQLLDEWVYTTRWTERVTAAENVDDLASIYR